jgi:hypothetical protein
VVRNDDRRAGHAATRVENLIARLYTRPLGEGQDRLLRVLSGRISGREDPGLEDGTEASKK